VQRQLHRHRRAFVRARDHALAETDKLRYFQMQLPVAARFHWQRFNRFLLLIQFFSSIDTGGNSVL